jgi:hypothetical protein
MPTAVSEGGSFRVTDKPAASDWQAEIEVIGERTRETLALLRQLVEMLLPKGDDPDKPKLEDLIAAMVAQQARIVALLAQQGAHISTILELLTRRDEGGAGMRQPMNGGLRS